jgi:hypothetical protein
MCRQCLCLKACYGKMCEFNNYTCVIFTGMKVFHEDPHRKYGVSLKRSIPFHLIQMFEECVQTCM